MRCPLRCNPTEREQCPTVVFWTQRDDLSPLKHALEKTAYINWKSDPAFSCVALDHYPMVQSVLQQNAPHLMFRNSTFFRLPRETAKAMNVRYVSDVRDALLHKATFLLLLSIYSAFRMDTRC